MSTFKNLIVEQEIGGCISDYIIERGQSDYCIYEKWKSGKLVQYGTTIITTDVVNNGDGSSQYNLYNSDQFTLQLAIPNVDRKYCAITCCSNTGAFASVSTNYSTTHIGAWIYCDVVLANRNFIIYFIDIGEYE